MRDNRGIERDVAGIDRKFKALWAAIEALRSERRAAATTVGSGDWIVDGGDVLMLDADGSVMFRLGSQEYGDRGVTMSRENGTDAISFRKRFALAINQTLEMFDTTGNRILAESEFGSGLDAPWFPLTVAPFYPTSTAAQAGPHGLEGQAVSSSTFTTTHIVELPRQNQHSRWRFAVKASDTTTAAEVQVIRTSDGTPLNKALSPAWVGVRAAGSTGYVDVDPGGSLVLPGNFAEFVRLEVQVRVTAGAGSLTVAVPYAYGSAP